MIYELPQPLRRVGYQELGVLRGKDYRRGCEPELISEGKQPRLCAGLCEVDWGRIGAR